MFAWAAAFGLVALVVGIAGFGGLREPAASFQSPFSCLISSFIAFIIAGIRRYIRRDRERPVPSARATGARRRPRIQSSWNVAAPTPVNVR